jgi:hypothetical protein
MRIADTILGSIPIVLMAGGTILYFVPATWVELPIETNTLGSVLFGLGVVVLYGGYYAGWYDRFDTDSDTSTDDTTYKFDIESEKITDDTASTAPAQTTGQLAKVGPYVYSILIFIGATLSWGQIRNPDRWTLVDGPPLQLPWGEQPVLGFAFIVSGMALFALIHIAIPFFKDK